MQYQQTTPSPEETFIAKEEIMDLCDKVDLLRKLVFHQPILFEAWYQFNVLSNSISSIARNQQITFYIAKKRIQTAEDILLKFQSFFRKIDD